MESSISPPARANMSYGTTDERNISPIPEYQLIRIFIGNLTRNPEDAPAFPGGIPPNFCWMKLPKPFFSETPVSKNTEREMMRMTADVI
jgi:hypothetical protein